MLVKSNYADYENALMQEHTVLPEKHQIFWLCDKTSVLPLGYCNSSLWDQYNKDIYLLSTIYPYMGIPIMIICCC